MPPFASSAIFAARTLLNDEQGSNWTTQKLMPKIAVAYNEMLNELVRNSVPIVNQISTIMTVVPNNTDDANVDLSQPASISAGTYPTDMIEPIWMKERTVGQSNADFVDMVKVDFIPNIALSPNQLVWWSWQSGVIKLRGCSTSVQVQLRYRRLLTAPTKATDDMIVTLCDTFVGPEAAYLCMSSLPNADQSVLRNIKGVAERNLDNIIAEATKGIQNLPAKRRPYHRGRDRSRAIRDF